MIKSNERSRFDMVEFGEQLRRAREGKGMTQQSLAEQLYVTRQSVSRWECGDRYLDLLTTKKISQILDVSLDDLLAGKEMVKLVERNPVIEKKSANYIMIALYAFIVFSFLITIIDMIIRFPLQSQADCIFYLWIISSCKGHIISQKDGCCYCSVFWCNVYNRI